MGTRTERTATTGETDVLLVGGGVASVRCARALRREGFDGGILIVGDEPILPYNRPPLSKELLRDDLSDDLVLAEPARWFERRRVDVGLGRGVTALDTHARAATLDDGSAIRFEQALLATGARPRRPPIPGAERALLLRTVTDARRIRAQARPGGTAVIIGGGLIGVEVGSALASLGMRVTVVEVAAQLWGGAFGEATSGWARDRLEAIGVRVLTATAVEAVVDGGVTVGGSLVPSDLVVAGVGVVPNDELARDAGLRTDDGIVVGSDQRTSADGIYAAGDVARIDGRRVEHWHAAREAGERAAHGMLGRPVPIAQPPWIFTEVAGARLDVVGWAPGWDEIVELRGGTAPAWAFLVGGRAVQVAIVDGSLPVEAVRAAVAERPLPTDLPTAD